MKKIVNKPFVQVTYVKDGGSFNIPGGGEIELQPGTYIVNGLVPQPVVLSHQEYEELASRAVVNVLERIKNSFSDAVGKLDPLSYVQNVVDLIMTHYTDLRDGKQEVPDEEN